MNEFQRKIEQLFNDRFIVNKIQSKLPKLFQLAEVESMRGGKIGMEVGTIRERIIIALLIYHYGRDNVKSEISTTKSEVDVELFKTPISIKTKSGKGLSGVKLIWTVDADKSNEFLESYTPSCELIFTHIIWNGLGCLYFIPQEVQLSVLNAIGRADYIKIPKVGTNPRGVEITSEALGKLTQHKGTYTLPIQWIKEKIDYDIYERWEKLWEQD